MASSEIRPLTREDLAFAQSLRIIAGWNQTDADWLRLLEHEPEGCFLIESEGRQAGTATTTCHGDQIGWIGMVLVLPEFRRRGLATRLLRRCLDYLRPRTRCIKLDATPEGKLVYERMGFEEESRLHRWSGRLSATEKSEIELSTVGCSFPTDLDRQAFGGDRERFLERLSSDSRKIVLPEDHGYGMIRAGSLADYLGPLVARSPEDGKRLVNRLLAGAGEVIWDIPDDNAAAAELAERLGLAPRRPLIRMRLGEDGFAGDPFLQWAIGGPETG